MDAYGLTDDQISGPAWTDMERFDVAAKVPDGATKEQFRVMLRNLLAERFHMTVHMEKRNYTVCEMTLAKEGLKMKESITDPKAETPQVGPDGQTLPVRFTVKDGFVSYNVSQMRMADIVKAFKRRSVRVVDKTGLTGKYDFALSCPDSGPRPATEIQDDPATPDFIAAVQKKLGLQLQKTRAPLDFVVIDRADRVPTAN